MTDKKAEMPFEVDTLFGHIIEASDQGPVYRDDGTLVDFAKPRPCKGCSRQVNVGEQDPCIANLPGTIHACCGHGLESMPDTDDRMTGYVALDDGRRIEFSGWEGGDNIKAAVAIALEGGELPSGFQESDKMWWSGLTEEQRAYVMANMEAAIFKLVRRITDGQFPPDTYLEDDSMWYEGVPEDKKKQVFASMGGMMAELVAEALKNA